MTDHIDQALKMEEILKAAGAAVKMKGAGTGSIYLDVTAGVGEADEDGEYDDIETRIIRFADHGECYCREDISVDPDGLTFTQAMEYLADEFDQLAGITE